MATFRLSRKYAVLLVSLAAILPFLNSLPGDFVWDDRTLILQDYKIQHPGYFSRFFLSDYFAHADEEIKYGYYRPLLSLSFMADFLLWQDRPFGYHLTNVLLHGAVSLLVFLLLSRVFRRRGGVALVSALTFAVHPVHTESVAWISGRTDLIATLFMLLSLLALSSAPSRRWGLALSLLSFLVALFAKESALALPLIAAAYLAAFEPVWSRPRIWRLVFLYGICVGAYLAIRFGIARVQAGSVAVLTLPETVCSSLSTLFLYVGKVFFPVGLSAYITNPVAGSLFDPRAAAGAAVLAALLVTLARSWRRRDRPLAFTVAFALAALAPLANLVRISGPADMGFPAAERFLYAPSIALIAVSVSLLARVPKGWFARVVTVAAVLLLAALTARRNVVWRDEGTLFADALKASPEAPLLWNNLGVYYSRSGRHAEAVECLERAISLSGSVPRLRVNLAAALRQAGRFEESLALLDSSRAGSPLPAAISHNRGKTLAAMGKDRAAIAEFEEALRSLPDRVEILIDLAEAHKGAGEYDRAERAYLRALALHPSSPLWSNLGVVRKLKGDERGAREAFERSIALEDRSSAARGNLGVLLARMGLYAEARGELEAARRLDPGNLDAANGLGVLFVRLGEEERAEELFLELARSHTGNPEAFINLGILKLRQGDRKAAGSWFGRGRELAPADPRVVAFFAGTGG
jgi:Flp pilus assembly protein TadD